MKGWQWNGHDFEPCGGVPLDDRGFRYGMAVFETIALLNGKALFLDAHLASLRRAAASCRFAYPEAVERRVRPLLEDLGVVGVARIYLTADGRLFILAETREPIGDGTRYSIAPEVAVHLPFPFGMKTGNYWHNLACIESARQKGHDEAILVTPEGLVISACMANVFAVHGGSLSTPSPATGARAGVVRAWVFQQMPVRERDLRLEDFETADEIFLTNSWIGVMPVTAFRKSLPCPGVVTAELAGRYRSGITVP